MTGKQLAFANRIIAGDQPSIAYRAAGYSTLCNPRVIAVAAQRTLNHPEVAAHIANIVQAVSAKVSISREEKMQRLAARIRAGKTLDPVGLKALEVHNVMTGDNAPEEVNVFGLGDLLTLVRKGKKPDA